MKHYGDITKLKGAELPVVDIVIGGSPCQDLSIAGRRDGLSGERSGLFMEQIRVIKELRDECKRQLSMRGSDDIVRPRYMVWENVPGAFSSNKGEDFRIVLEETARIVEETAVIPKPPRGGWSKSGCIMGDGWSIAWRVHDAQFWGVPQRRKRIALVADFGGESAPEILFERKSVSGDFEQSAEERERTASDVGAGAYTASVYCLQGNGIDRSDTAGCNGKGWREGQCYTLNTIDRPAVYFEPRSQDGIPRIHDDISPTLNTAQGGQRQLCVCIGNGQTNQSVSDIAGAINCMHDQQAVMVAAVDCRNGVENEEINGTLLAKSTGGTGVNFNNVYRQGSVVRRLTPLECERLQGYPDGWTDIGEWIDTKGKKHKEADSPRYKALGNSIALPFWQWMAERMVKQLQDDGVEYPTMASLFDGISGFPLVFQRCGAELVWSSEIEEFPIAVAKKHFPEGGTE